MQQKKNEIYQLKHAISASNTSTQLSQDSTNAKTQALSALRAIKKLEADSILNTTQALLLFLSEKNADKFYVQIKSNVSKINEQLKSINQMKAANIQPQLFKELTASIQSLKQYVTQFTDSMLIDFMQNMSSLESTYQSSVTDAMRAINDITQSQNTLDALKAYMTLSESYVWDDLGRIIELAEKREELQTLIVSLNKGGINTSIAQKSLQALDSMTDQTAQKVRRFDTSLLDVISSLSEKLTAESEKLNIARKNDEQDFKKALQDARGIMSLLAIINTPEIESEEANAFKSSMKTLKFAKATFEDSFHEAEESDKTLHINKTKQFKEQMTSINPCSSPTSVANDTDNSLQKNSN